MPGRSRNKKTHPETENNDMVWNRIISYLILHMISQNIVPLDKSHWTLSRMRCLHFN